MAGKCLIAEVMVNHPQVQHLPVGCLFPSHAEREDRDSKHNLMPSEAFSVHFLPLLTYYKLPWLVGIHMKRHGSLSLANDVQSNHVRAWPAKVRHAQKPEQKSGPAKTRPAGSAPYTYAS